MSYQKVFTTKGHGVIEGHHYGDKQVLVMVTEYKSLKAIPKRYELIDTTSDITKYTLPLTKKVKRHSDNRIVFQRLIKEIQSGTTVRIGAHVVNYNKELEQYEVYHKIKMV